jgi:peptidoglycan-associated lipoprotein
MLTYLLRGGQVPRVTVSRNFRLAGMLALAGLMAVACSNRPTAGPQVAAPPAPVTPVPPPPAPVLTFAASPTAISPGQPVTLSWESTNANSVRIEPEVGEVMTSGSRSVSPASSVTYSAVATGPGGSATETVRVTVTMADAPPSAPPLPRAPEATIIDLFESNVVPIYFDYDESGIRPDQAMRLQRNAEFLLDSPDVDFTIGGHADERGTTEYNIGLADRRANTIRQYLIERGISADRINVVSFGEERPICREMTESCWQQNRRADFTLRN